MYNKKNRKIILLLFFIGSAIFLFPAISYSQYWGLKWHQIKSKPFIIHYLNNDVTYSDIVLKTLKNFYPRLSSEIGYQEKSTIMVFLCNSDKAYNLIVGKNFPKWSEGVAQPANKLIIIKSGVNSSKIIVHELTHILLHSAVNSKPIPRWFDEGLAVFYSDEQEFASSSLISKALITNSIIPLSDIDDVLTFHTSKAQLAYQESYLAVLFLIEEFGLDGIKRVVTALAEKENEDQALIAAIGIDLWDFETAWIKYLKRKYRWHFLVEFDTYLWLFILLLFLAGFMLMRRRNKKTMQRWEEEDRY